MTIDLIAALSLSFLWKGYQSVLIGTPGNRTMPVMNDTLHQQEHAQAFIVASAIHPGYVEEARHLIARLLETGVRGMKQKHNCKLCSQGVVRKFRHRQETRISEGEAMNRHDRTCLT